MPGALCQTCAEIKEEQGDTAYYKPEREAQVLRQIMEKNAGPSGQRRDGASVSTDHVRLFGPRTAN